MTATLFPPGNSPFDLKPMGLPGSTQEISSVTLSTSSGLAFINIVVFSDPPTNPPTGPSTPVKVELNNISGGAGPATGFQTLTFDSGGGFSSINTTGLQPDGVTPLQISARYRPHPSGAVGVFQVELAAGSTGFPLDGSGWQIQFTNQDALEYFFTVLVDGADTTQPWLGLPPNPIDFGQASALMPLTIDGVSGSFVAPKKLVTGVIYDLDVPIYNYGTAPLVISIASDVTVSEFILKAASITIAPGSFDYLTVQYKDASSPATSGQHGTVGSPRAFSVPTADTVHVSNIGFFATTGSVEVVLLLDASGSMGSQADPGADPTTRWEQLSSPGAGAGLIVTNLRQFAAGQGFWGAALYPDPTNPSTFGRIIQPRAPITSSISLDLSAFSPNGGTPMGGAGGGVETAMGKRISGGGQFDFGLFLGPANASDTAGKTARDFNHRWLILMSDGAHNTPTEPDSPTADTTFDPAVFADSYYTTDKRVQVITIAFGTPGQEQVDYTRLDHIATNSTPSGSTPHALIGDPVANPSGFITSMLKALTSGLGLSFASDPEAVLLSTASENRHQTIVSDYDSKVSFVVSCGTLTEGSLLHVELITPNGERVTPSNSAQFGIVFTSGALHRSYFADETALTNSSPPRRGTWIIVVSREDPIEIEIAAPGKLKAAAGQPTLRYAYHTLVDSKLSLVVGAGAQAHYAGDPIDVFAALTINGRPLTNALVTAQLLQPGQSVDNWLAGQQVTDAEYAAALASLGGMPDVQALMIKTLALKQKGIVFPGFDAGGTQLLQPDPSGIYAARYSATKVPGNYQFYVTAIGTDPSGNILRREHLQQVRVGVLADPVWSLVDLSFSQIGGQVQATLRFWPRDRYGNVVLVDPAVNSTIRVIANGATVVGKLQGKGDGSYVQALTYPTGTQPTIGITVGGHNVVTGLGLPNLSTMRFVDEVVSFKPGSQFASGANHHVDPSKALGNVSLKPLTDFVSLGGHGVATFDIKGSLITGKRVTVYVAPDTDLRSYSVEVLPVWPTASWIEIGRSAGVTQTFSLVPRKLPPGGARDDDDAFLEIKGSILDTHFDIDIDLDLPGKLGRVGDWLHRLGHKGLKAIRVVDLSGRTINRDGTPSNTPGVSVLGIGFSD